MEGQSPQVVAKRALILNGIVAASFNVSKDKIVAWLKEESLWASVSEWERGFLTEMESDKIQYVRANQLSEAMATLLWALEKIPVLPEAQRPCNLKAVIALMPNLFTSTHDFIERAFLRSVEEINEFNRNIYENNWAIRDAQIHNASIPNNFHPVVVEQRHRASNWLCLESGLSWDDVSTDT